MKRTKAKKLISHLLAVSMCLTSVPAAALPVYAAEEQGVEGMSLSQLVLWDFNDGLQGWEATDGWSPVNIKDTIKSEHEKNGDEGRLKLTFDNSAESANGWSQIALYLNDMSKADFSQANQLSFDFYYDSNAMKQGDIAIKVSAGIEGEQNGNVFQDNANTLDITDGTAVEAGEGWYKKTCQFSFEGTEKTVNSFNIIFVGKNTDYNGSVYFDNIALSKDAENTPTQPSEPDNNQAGVIPEIWDFAEDTQGWQLRDGWSGATGDVSWDSQGQRLKLGLDYTGLTGDYPGVGACYTNANGLDFSAYNLMTMEVYFQADKALDEIGIGAEAQASDGQRKNLFESVSDSGSLLKGAEDAGNGWMKKIVKAKINEELAAELRPETFEIIFKVKDNKITSDVYIDNITFKKAVVEPVKEIYEFADSTEGWKSDSGWLSEGVQQNVSHDAAGGRLALELDFTAVADKGWQNSGMCIEADSGFSFNGYNKLTFDLYYRPSDMTKGSLIISPVAETDGNDNTKKIFQDQMSSLTDQEVVTVDAENGYKKASFTFKLTEANTANVFPAKFNILVKGNETDFHGTVYFDNIKFAKEDIYVYASETVNSQTQLSTDANGLNVNGTPYAYAADISLVDADASPEAKKIYQYLKAVGESESIIYGHMEDTVLKAGYAGLTESDTKDVTGSLPAVDGYDCGNLFAGFDEKYRNRGNDAADLGTGSTTEKNINAAAWFANQSIAEGAIVTLSAHMPNFAFAERIENPESAKTYDQFDYSKKDSYIVDNGNCMKNLLPGQEYNAAYTAYLDMIAEYAEKVNGAILFRPLHENTGGWFWWGNACTAQTYKNVFKYTVEYLRDIKGVHNFIYLYGPGSEAATEAEYEERYPGDGYVDMVGFDSYDAKPTADEKYTFQDTLRKTIELTSSFAKKHGKLFAITETGIANDNIALLTTGNPRKNWYCEILDLASKPEYNCCYLMLWSNYSSSAGYYTPYVVKKDENGLYGHEMLDGFIRFYNDRRTIFADQQKAILESGITPPQVSAADKGVLDGYFISPPEGSRLTQAVQICARLTKNTSEEVKFVLTGANGQSLELAAAAGDDGKTYTAQLTAEQLAALDPEPDGSMALYAGGQKLQEFWYIINIAEQADDPLVVDDFESYLGMDTLLREKWRVNKSSNSALEISLADDTHSAGSSYSLRFDFSLKKGGYVGAEISKTADWSGCNALQFWVKPDGKNQKTVIQLKVGNDAYEAYLNNYDAYRNAQKPLLVTLPFDVFKNTKNGSSLTSAAMAGMTGLGLWMNALDESFADTESILTGSLYYDDIKAVTTDSKEPVFEEASQSSPGGSTTPGGSNSGGSSYWPGSTTTPGGSTTAPGSTTTPGSNPTEPDNSIPVSDQVENKVIKGAVENTDGTFTDADGQLIRNAIVETADGNRYITDAQGRRRTSGFVDTTDGTTYYVKETGIVARKEIITVAEDKYFAKDTGEIAKSEFCTTAKGSTVYAKKDGKLASDQVITVEGSKYYMKKNCALAKKGFYTTSSGNRVYARKTGELVTNRVFAAGGKRYFAKASGAVAKAGFYKTALGNKVYAKASGELVVNKIFTVKGAKYYAKKSGAIAVSKWIQTGNKKYYCSASGKITKTKKVK